MLNPTKVQPVIFDKYSGVNDRQAPCKLERGNVSFEVNLDASNRVAKRRFGRDFFFLDPLAGSATGLWQTAWADGSVIDIGAIGSILYDLTFTFSAIIASGFRLIIQSPDLNYWDVTPNVDGVINPTAIAAPAAIPQAANLTIQNGESFGFARGSGVTRLIADVDHFGWYLLGYGPSIATTTYTDDVVFTIASGFSFRIVDYQSNTWKFQMSNDGNLQVITV
jgi:hypothetical protein